MRMPIQKLAPPFAVDHAFGNRTALDSHENWLRIPDNLVVFSGKASMSNFRLAIFTAGFTLAAVCALARSGPSAPIVVAYVFPRNGVLQPGQIDAAKLNRINYAFANIKDGLIVTGFAQDEVNLAYLAALREQHPSLKVLVSVGGWLWSGGFSDVSLTIESRQRFIQSVMEFLAHHHLDGLDIDWEYPGMTGAGNPFHSEDGHNFPLLLKELRIRFDEQAHKTGRRLYLTIAAGSSDEYLEQEG